MPDYIYLLENRLSPAQQNALRHVRDAARDAGMTVFLAGGAVRDLTSGLPVRDLDFSVQGNALKLRKSLEKAGATFSGDHEPSRTLYFWFPGSVRVEVSSARREEYPKPGKPVYHWAPILEDLRRRDFTANAMAISLNEGSWGLLLDPLNGFADIELRHLRLASNYGFIEDPIRMVRAVRFAARTGWEMDERTKARYQNARDEGLFDQVSPFARGYELEEIAHEEDPLRVLRALEAEGWMKALCPAWVSAKADVKGLEELNKILIKLLMLGVNPDPSAAHIELLTAKMPPKDVAGLKRLFPRRGFVDRWNNLEQAAKDFAKELLGKAASTPSATWKLLVSYPPEAVLWLAFSSKNPQVREKFNNFFNVWPEARQKIPTALMAEMRITPDLPEYGNVAEALFFQFMDGKLTTDEEIRAFLEPYSPPAPPPPVVIRRPRGRRAEPKIEEEEEELDLTPARSAGDDSDEESEEEDEGEELPPRPPAPSGKSAKVAKAPAKAAKVAPAVPEPKAAAKPGKPEPQAAPKAAAKTTEKKAAPAPAKAPVARPEPKPAKAPAKPAAKPATKAAKPAPRPAAKKQAAVPLRKSGKAGKVVAKPAAKKPAKPAPAKGKSSKPAGKPQKKKR
ncbi:MAG TPA: CCA tRNA nucleotidyltransferase [Acidobacteriaceae bacterium]|jgi:tRNA nucleotidyltransferase/poly(A) polymerase|nr:CCA tRNA nucleotidyltransferase [Acidobacteriaceae bacterium]